MIGSVLSTATSAINVAATVSGVTAHNLANIRTDSFKSKMATLAEMSNGGVQINSIREYKASGPLIPTGNNMDIVVFGQNNPHGLYQTYGHVAKQFSIDNYGNLRSPAGELIFSGAGKNISIDNEGNLFKDGDMIGTISPDGTGYIETGYSILSGYTIGSNVDLKDEMVTSITNQRFLDFNAVTLQTADEMLGAIINIKG